MKKAIVTAAMMLATTSVQALTPDEQKLELAFAALWLADWSQTAHISKHPDKYYEAWNKVLPTHPTRNQVRAYFISGLLAHYAISTALSGTEYSKYWQGITISAQVVAVHHNRQLGISVFKSF